MKTSHFDYPLPESLIAKEPPAVRGSSRLLKVDRHTGSFEDKHYVDVSESLSAGDVVVLNDTKVIPARLSVTKVSSGSLRELILLEKHGKTDDWHRHKVLYRRNINAGDKLQTIDGSEIVVDEIIGEGIAVVSSSRDLLDIAERIGNVPLPPYMHRDATPDDTARYQTVWAEHPGSVAAPTASLNMTEQMVTDMRAKGVIVCYATLHVGLGTFLPIRSDDLTGHTMHQEYYEIPEATVAAIQKAKAASNKVLAVGTTITRTLEYAADEVLSGKPQDLSGEADIFIYPGYEFKVIDMLVTNFHAPRSTVLMLTAAFCGWDHLKPAYAHAVAEKYAFLSYGDSMLIS